ncbi:hypothetical protein FPV67DRAFT_1777928 [Lyophyllum atratum]|nr:hypothetical protein FPV67DRAFT_1777928 [Lyophyllum atratum]
MFGTFTLTALLASASLLVVRADVGPTVPGPGTIYKEGKKCHIEWTGDAGSKTAWKNMAIELMTGDNFNMKHLTTVATGLDGTVAGTFDHPCPAVNPNSAIYFYQFSAPGATTKQWATRFAIASPSGATTPPPNALQPTTNAPIPWGVGALADPSKAVPAPVKPDVLGLLTSVTHLVARADVVPTVPGPGTIYKEGEKCHIEWTGDAGSKTAWKNMAIELMTGDNFNMKHLTTVATGLDGTVAGTFDHPCPAVIPNSAIYFYQFSAPGAASKQWATRFAIASPSGATTPPPNALQPTTNAPIPWGTGALADPSKAVPAPAKRDAPPHPSDALPHPGSGSRLVVRDVVPTVPGPGTIYKEGDKCHIKWTGDAGSKIAWKNMDIELMTGDNFNMKHLTTIATGLDGTVAGSFDHPCPAVIPNSAIYFYQFSSPCATTKQWTTRFAIASPSGATTPPPNALQPTTNAPIPWGIGALANPSKAARAPLKSGAPPPPQSYEESTKTLVRRFTTVSSSSACTSAASSKSGLKVSSKDNAAVAAVVDARVWQAAVALGASGLVFAVFL